MIVKNCKIAMKTLFTKSHKITRETIRITN